MKLQRPCILLFSMLLCFTSCKKEDDNVDKPTDYSLEWKNPTFINSINLPKQAYSALSIKFSYPIDTLFRLEDIDEKNNDFRLSYTLECLSDPKVDVEMMVYNNDSLVFYPLSGLWPRDSEGYFEMVKMNITVTLEVFDDDWKEVKGIFGELIRETRTFNFSFNSTISNPVGVSFIDLTDKFQGKFIFPTLQTLLLRANFPIATPVHVNPNAEVRLVVNNVVFSDNDDLVIETGCSTDNSDVIISIEQELQEEKKYTVNVELFFELKAKDSPWVEIGKRISYKAVYETRLLNSEIDLLLKYSYPALNQYHFLKDEYPKGYLRFSKLPEAIALDSKRSKGNDYMVRITNHASEEYVDVACSYVPDSLYFEYNMPTGFLDNEAVYKISLLSNPSSGSSPLSYYSYFFRTSKFNDALSKFNDYTDTFSYLQIITTGIHVQGLAVYPFTEPFDYWEAQTETNRLEYNTGLIRMEILPDESSIFQVQDYKTLYDKLLVYPQALTWRTPEHMGIPPRYNTGYVRSSYGANHPGYLTPELIEQGAAPIPLSSSNSGRRHDFIHAIGLIASQDYHNLRDYLRRVQGEDLELFIAWFTNCNLMFNVNYVLPGLNITTSTKKFKYN